MHQLEFYFDCSSPWTYLAFESVQRIAARPDVEMIWRPLLVGGLFNSINPSVYESRANPIPAKVRYYQKDLRDWADYVGIEIGSPPVFPVNSVRAMRGAFHALGEGVLVPYARAVFEAYWRDLRDISDLEVLQDVVTQVGLNWPAYQAAIDSDALKKALRDSTETCARRGGFGSPTLFLDGDDMYFGNDRLPLLEAKLGPLS